MGNQEDLNDRLYFKQLLAGMDFAESDGVAAQMLNLAYLIGDKQTKQAIIVDPAYDIAGILGVAEADGMEVVGALGTHYHADHVGGSLMGYEVSGVAELLEKRDVPIHIQESEVPWVSRSTGLGPSELVGHSGNDTISVGEVEIELIHTPGHTPGSQCFLVGDKLIAGDTLFLNGCGRTDLPGGDADQLYYSLVDRLAKIPDSTTLYPGHLYSPESSDSMERVRRNNYVFRPTSIEQWRAMFSG